MKGIDGSEWIIPGRARDPGSAERGDEDSFREDQGHHEPLGNPSVFKTAISVRRSRTAMLMCWR